MTTEFWRRWLLCGSLLTAAYAALLVVAGAVASRLFDALGFGMRTGAIPEGLPERYVSFVYAVLGSVLVGWMLLVAAVAAGPLRTGERWAWPALAVSVATWFVLDTGYSTAIASWQHALFNLGFLMALGVPLVGWRLASRTPTARSAAGLVDSRSADRWPTGGPEADREDPGPGRSTSSRSV